MGLNWLITGGCGFIGCNLIERLQADGTFSIRILDNLSVGSEADLARVCCFAKKDLQSISEAPKGIELVVGDITSADDAKAAAAGIDVIVHLAANTGVGPSVENPVQDCTVNVFGTLNMLEAARAQGCNKFVFASSGAPLGDVEPPIHENKVPKPVSPYGASKLAGEGYCSAYFNCFKISTVCLRFSNVYGPLSAKKSSVVAKFIGDALAGRTLTIYGDGAQTRDFIYVTDLVEAIIKSANSTTAGGEIFQIATNQETSLSTLVTQLEARFEKCGVAMPDVANEAERLGDVRRNFSDTSKAREFLDWQATTTLESGLAKTMAHFLQQDSATQK